MLTTEKQTSFEQFLYGLGTTIKWLGIVAGSLGLLAYPPVAIFAHKSGAHRLLLFWTGAAYGVGVGGGLVGTAVKSGLIHGWASMRELNAILRREAQVNKLLLKYQDHLEMRKASEDLLRELGASQETLTRIRETSAELDRLKAERQQLA